jgi:hypothetical protein
MIATVPRSAFVALAFAGALALATPSTAEMVNFKADLKAASEVPPNDSKGSGSVTATYDTASKKLSYKGGYSGLTGPATAAHFHGPAEPGNNAGMQIPVFSDSTAKSPFEGEATLTDAQASDLMADKWYFNIQGVERSRRIAAWTAPDEFDHLLQFARCEFGHDVVDARLWSRRTAAMTVSGTPSAAAHLTDARSLAGTYPTSGLRAAGVR